MVCLLKGALAQLVERNNGIVEVSGSIPLRSSMKRPTKNKPVRQKKVSQASLHKEVFKQVLKENDALMKRLSKR